MCKFCESIMNKDKTMVWESRNRYADDNFCEKVLDDSCDNCSECTEKFILRSYNYEGNTMLVNEFEKTNGDIKIHLSSESLHINFCPYCGKQISKDIKDFNNIHEHIISIFNLDGSIYDYEMDKFIEEVM